MYKKVLEKIRGGLLFCIKWRYLIALVAFVLCVALKLHGSSINEYNKMFDNYGDYASESLILGESRPVRSDEWLVHTPYYMSQTYNDFNKESHMMSIDGQDMIIGYNAPVADITIVAKPFTWGYVLLGNEYGLSWYWCSKLILLILVSFEACMIITRKNKKVSLLGAIMVAFAPTVQWWFVPHMVDVFFWGLAVFVLAYHFFVSDRWWRVLFMILLPLSVITFVLALFPSLQISVGLTMLVLFIVCLIRDKQQITFKKKDIWRIVVMALFALGVIGWTIWTSKDAIVTLYSTVYPGKRVSLGDGEGLKVLFTNLTTFTLPHKDITYLNNCEVSTFIQFAPVFMILYPVIWKKMKRNKNMIVGNALLVCLIVMGVFMMVGFPELLSKITGFSYIDTHRMKIAYGFAATLFTVWGIDMVWKKQLFTKKQIFGVVAIIGALYIMFVGAQELTYFGWKHYLLIIAGIMVVTYLILGRYKKISLVVITLIMLASGATINPIARGVSALYAHPMEQKIREISNGDKDAYWLAIGNTGLAQLGISNGARMLNAVNFYPDYGKWDLIDENRAHDKIYNRYAHIQASLTGGETEYMSGAAPDVFSIKFSCEDVIKLGIKYLATEGEIEFCKDDFKKIYSDTEGKYYIYERVDYEAKNS